MDKSKGCIEPKDTLILRKRMLGVKKTAFCLCAMGLLFNGITLPTFAQEVYGPFAGESKSDEKYPDAGKRPRPTYEKISGTVASLASGNSKSESCLLYTSPSPRDS